MFNYNLILRDKPYHGETMSGNICGGIFDTYKVISDNKSWEVTLMRIKWDNGEEEVSAIDVFPDKLTLIKNRLRLSVNKASGNYQGYKYVVLRMATLKKDEITPWANLRNASLGELNEIVQGNIRKYFQRLGVKAIDYKSEILGQAGSTGNQVIIIYDKEDGSIPIHSFVITRILPLVSDVILSI